MLARLHTAIPQGIRVPGQPLQLLAARQAIDQALDSLGVPWNGGPYAEPGRDLLARYERPLRQAFARFDGDFESPAVGDLPTQMVPHIFRSLADGLGATIHVRVAGDNEHHKVEACFKAFGRALRQGIMREGKGRDDLPSTKGML